MLVWLKCASGRGWHHFTQTQERAIRAQVRGKRDGARCVSVLTLGKVCRQFDGELRLTPEARCRGGLNRVLANQCRCIRATLAPWPLVASQQTVRMRQGGCR